MINGEIEELQTVKVKDREIKVEYYVAADWKMLANLIGIVAANGRNPCIWCNACKDEFWDVSKTWSIIDKHQSTRSFNTCDEMKEPVLTKTI